MLWEAQKSTKKCIFKWHWLDYCMDSTLRRHTARTMCVCHTLCTFKNCTHSFINWESDSPGWMFYIIWSLSEVVRPAVLISSRSVWSLPGRNDTWVSIPQPLLSSSGAAFPWNRSLTSASPLSIFFLFCTRLCWVKPQINGLSWRGGCCKRTENKKEDEKMN